MSTAAARQGAATSLGSIATAPRCVLVTGPRGRGPSQWVHEQIRQVQKQRLGIRCAYLVADQGLVCPDRSADDRSAVMMRSLYMPCMCCPAVADLPGAVRALAAGSRAEWLGIELPVLAAGALLAEFDRQVGWARDFVVCLNPEWAGMRQCGQLSLFQGRLLALATRVIEPAAHRNCCCRPSRGRSRRQTVGSVLTLVEPTFSSS